MKGFIGFLAGTLIGSVSAVLITRKIVSEKWKKISEEQVSSMKKYVDQLRRSEEIKKSAENLGYTVSKTENMTTVAHQTPETQKKVSQMPKVDYSSMYKPVSEATAHPTEGSDEEDEDIEKLKKWSEKVDKESKENFFPRILTEEEYLDPDYNHHDKEHWFYYIDDGVVLSEEGEVIAVPEQYIGEAIHTSGFDVNDVEELYVRNWSRSTDYRLEKIFGAYADE